MTADFISGFVAAAGVLAWLAGVASAIVLAVGLGLALAWIAGAVFDGATSILAKRWAQKKRKPRNRFERIILAHRERQEEDGEV